GLRINGAYYSDQGFDQIDLLSGNLNVSLPLLVAQSRRLSVGVTLAYNSQVWSMDRRGVQSLGMDTGAGFGWRAGTVSISPIRSRDSGGTEYVFVNDSGAEYP